MLKFKSPKLILSFFLILFSILAFILNAFVLIYNSHNQKQLATKIATDKSYHGITGAKGYNGIPGFLSFTERSIESWPITLLYEKDKTGQNAMFGDLTNWFSPSTPPTFQIENKITTLKLNFYDQTNKDKRKFYKGDRIFFDFDIALNQQKTFDLGVFFNIKNFHFGNHLATEYTKIWHLLANNELHQHKLQKFNSVSQKRRVQFFLIKTPSINRIKIQGRISFTSHGIYVDIFSTLVDQENTINQFVATSKIALDSLLDKTEKYAFESIQIGKIDANGILIPDDDLTNPIWKNGTKIKFWQDPSNWEFIHVHKEKKQAF